MGDPAQLSSGLHFSWKQIMVVTPAVLAVFGLGTMVSPRLAVIDKDTLQAITLSVKEDGRQDETFVGGGGVARHEFGALVQVVERNAKQIERLIGVTTTTNENMVRLLERSTSARAP